MRHRQCQPAGATVRRDFRVIAATASILLSLVPAFPAGAAESFTLIQPPGGTDLDQAVLPPPGWYGAAILIPYNSNQRYYDGSGKRVPADQNVKLSVPILAAGLLYSYPFEVAGGRLASSLTLAAYDLDYELPGNTKGRVKGMADAYADVFYWTKNVGLAGVTPGELPLSYGLNVGAGLGLHIPMGKYDKARPANPGNNIWMPIPNASLTYVTGPNMSLGDATELSARVFYGFPFKNPDTDYRSGQIFNVDFSAVQRFGNLRVGMAGAYQTQTTRDRPPADGSIPDLGRTSFMNLGPIAAYAIPEHGIELKAKLTFSMNPKSTTDATVFALSVSKKF